MPAIPHPVFEVLRVELNTHLFSKQAHPHSRPSIGGVELTLPPGLGDYFMVKLVLMERVVPIRQARTPSSKSVFHTLPLESHSEVCCHHLLLGLL